VPGFIPYVLISAVLDCLSDGVIVHQLYAHLVFGALTHQDGGIEIGGVVDTVGIHSVTPLDDERIAWFGVLEVEVVEFGLLKESQEVVGLIVIGVGSPVGGEDLGGGLVGVVEVSKDGDVVAPCGGAFDGTLGLEIVGVPSGGDGWSADKVVSEIQDGCIVGSEVQGVVDPQTGGVDHPFVEIGVVIVDLKVDHVDVPRTGHNSSFFWQNHRSRSGPPSIDGLYALKRPRGARTCDTDVFIEPRVICITPCQGKVVEVFGGLGLDDWLEGDDVGDLWKVEGLTRVGGLFV